MRLHLVLVVLAATRVGSEENESGDTQFTYKKGDNWEAHRNSLVGQRTLADISSANRTGAAELTYEPGQATQ